MAVNFKLGDRRPLPAGDPMGRAWVGWDPERTDQELYEQNRGRWLLGPRVRRETFATFSYQGEVKIVVQLTGTELISPRPEEAAPKTAIIGHVLGPGDPGYAALHGRRVDAHRNPVTYLNDDDGPISRCGCGCGLATSSARAFLPGHDQRAVHERIARRWGSVLGFIKWFDSTE